MLGMPLALHARLEQSAAELAELLSECESELPLKPRQYGARPTGRITQGALASWNTQVAMLVLEVHAGIRELEANLKYAVSGHVRERGGSDANTARAIASVVALAAAAGDYELRSVLRQVEAWGWRARLALGHSEPLQQLPRQPGQSAARCPWCGKATLRMKPVIGLVKCINPACSDDTGCQPVARVAFGQYSDEPILVWADNSVGLGSGTEPDGGTVGETDERESP
jgi:hypothetical protein